MSSYAHRNRSCCHANSGGSPGIAMAATDFVKTRHEIHGDCVIFIFTFCNDQNQFNPESIKAIHEALDMVKTQVRHIAQQNSSVKRAALVTVGEGKFYSTGLMLSHPFVQKNLPDFLSKHYLPLMARFLVFPIVTVAALNGHGFAGGMVMAVAHDFRVMRADRGYLCMNEIELPSPVPAGMAAVIRAKTPNPNTVRDIFLDAKRYSAKESLELGLIDKVATEEACLSEAIEMAMKHARTIALMPIVESIKRDMYPEAIELCEKPDSMQHVPELIMKSKL